MLWKRSDCSRGRTVAALTVYSDEQGSPTGVVTEIFDRMPPWPADLVAKAVALREQDLLLSHGITSISSIPFVGTEMRAVRIAQRRGGLDVRIRHYPVHPWGARLDSFEQLGVDSFLGDDFYRFGGVELFVDGIGSDGLSGVVDDSKYEQDELNDVAARAERLGLQVLSTPSPVAASRWRPTPRSPRAYGLPASSDVTASSTAAITSTSRTSSSFGRAV